jgi:hypothetical protein
MTISRMRGDDRPGSQDRQEPLTAAAPTLHVPLYTIWSLMLIVPKPESLSMV